MAATFTSSWSGDAAFVSWNFGDGNPLVQQTWGNDITYSFLSPGVYQVTSTARNAIGSSVSPPLTVTVGSLPTLARGAWDALKAAAAGKVLSGATADLYTSGTTRNAGNWLAAWDWTSRGYNGNFTAVTRRHVVFATHAGIPTDPQWVDAAGTLVTGSVVSQRQVRLGSSGSVGDLSVATLSADLPTGVTPAAFAPADLATRLNPQSEGRVSAVILPVASGRQSRSVGMTSFNTWDVVPNESEARRFGYFVAAGDSGSPVFVIAVGLPPILLTHAFFSGLGPQNPVLASELNAITTADGYPLTFPDLSAYTAYL